MTFIIGENTYIACVFFIANNERDVMGALVKESALDREWLLSYRFRYYAKGTASDTDPFSDEDEKSWYSARKIGTEDELMKDLRRLVATVVLTSVPNAHTVEIVPVNGGIEAWHNALKGKSWAHFRDDGQGNADAKGVKR